MKIVDPLGPREMGASDRTWFATRRGRAHRVRPATAADLRPFAIPYKAGVPGGRRWVVVRKVSKAQVKVRPVIVHRYQRAPRDEENGLSSLFSSLDHLYFRAIKDDYELCPLFDY